MVADASNPARAAGGERQNVVVVTVWVTVGDPYLAAWARGVGMGDVCVLGTWRQGYPPHPRQWWNTHSVENVPRDSMRVARPREMISPAPAGQTALCRFG